MQGSDIGTPGCEKVSMVSLVTLPGAVRGWLVWNAWLGGRKCGGGGRRPAAEMQRFGRPPAPLQRGPCGALEEYFCEFSADHFRPERSVSHFQERGAKFTNLPLVGCGKSHKPTTHALCTESLPYFFFRVQSSPAVPRVPADAGLTAVQHKGRMGIQRIE